MTAGNEARWQSWARELCVGGDGHLDECIATQQVLRRLDSARWSKIVRPGLRWPGYLGAGYRDGGILSVGIVHTDFDTAGLRGRGDVPDAVRAHVAWSDREIDDKHWLVAIRRMYRAGLSWPGGWSVAKHHSFYWSALGESVDSIAYVNAMRCQWPGKGPASAAVDRCVARCSLDGLVDILRPRLVISNSAQAFERLRHRVPSLYVHQLNGRNLAAVTVDGADGEMTIDVGNREDTTSALRMAGFTRVVTD